MIIIEEYFDFKGRKLAVFFNKDTWQIHDANNDSEQTINSEFEADELEEIKSIAELAYWDKMNEHNKNQRLNFINDFRLDLIKITDY